MRSGVLRCLLLLAVIPPNEPKLLRELRSRWSSVPSGAVLLQLPLLLWRLASHFQLQVSLRMLTRMRSTWAFHCLSTLCICRSWCSVTRVVFKRALISESLPIVFEFLDGGSITSSRIFFTSPFVLISGMRQWGAGKCWTFLNCNSAAAQDSAFEIRDRFSFFNEEGEKCICMVACDQNAEQHRCL